MNIPILIVHKGDSFYLEPVLRQIRLFNPDNRICLISDESTSRYNIVEHFYIDHYTEGLQEFQKVYQHMSINPYDYELFCFQRWFVIRDFVRKEGFTHFLCLDSDVLLYCNVDEVFNQYLKYDFTICKVMGPCFSLFNKESIDKLCDYMLFLYTDKGALERLRLFYKDVVYGGVCDMTALTWYQKDISNNVIDIIYPSSGACFDGNISDPMGFEMSKSRKRIYWIDNLPYGKYMEDGSLIRFYGLHLQGGAKHEMHKYVLDNQKIHQIGLYDTLKWKFSFKRLKCRYQELRKMFSSSTMFCLMLKNKLRIS
jgi:hypothetical protein